MPTYKYVAIDLQKKKHKGIYIAEDEQDLAVQLTKQNLYLVKSTVYKSGTPSAFFTLGTGKVKLSEITLFCRQFSIMLSTGITLLNCIDNLKRQHFSSYFRSILQVISEDIKAGAMLSEAIDKHKKIFPSFFCSMVHVGEASGKLDTVFMALADYYETDSSIKRKVKAALTYPTVLACLTLGIIVILLGFVVPTFRQSLSSLDVQLNDLTLAIYNISDFLLTYWRTMVVGVIAVIGVLFLFSRTKQGKRFFDVFKVKVPIFGRVQINMITARFARAFSILLSSGMDMATALDTTTIILGNSYVEERFRDAAADVHQGVSLTDAFAKQNLFPQILLQMIAVGEQTASLEEVLQRSCNFFDDEVERSLGAMTAIIQPAMLLIMGTVVAVLFMAVYSPMLAIMGTLA